MILPRPRKLKTQYLVQNEIGWSIAYTGDGVIEVWVKVPIETEGREDISGLTLTSWEGSVVTDWKISRLIMSLNISGLYFRYLPGFLLNFSSCWFSQNSYNFISSELHSRRHRLIKSIWGIIDARSLKSLENITVETILSTLNSSKE